VVVTPRAAHRQAQKYSGVCLHAVHDVLHRVLFGNDAVLGVRPVVAIETGGHFLFQRRVGQHVAGNLIARELVERQIAVECVDHPVAPSPHHALAVELISVGIRVARCVQPAKGHSFAIARRCQQAVDNFFIRVRRMVFQEHIDFRGRGRQARQIERHAPNQRLPLRLGRRRQPFASQLLADENIDRRGLRGRNRRKEGPVLLPLRAFRHPLAQGRDFRGAQRQTGGRGRHPHRRLRCRGALDQAARLRVAFDDRATAAAQIRFRGLLAVQAKGNMFRSRVGAVADVAFVGKDRPDVAIELDRAGIQRRERQQREPVSHELIVAETRSSVPCSSSVKNGFVTSGITMPTTLVDPIFRLRAT